MFEEIIENRRIGVPKIYNWCEMTRMGIYVLMGVRNNCIRAPAQGGEEISCVSSI